MSELKTQGVVHIIGQKVQVTDKVSKRTMSIKTDDKYPQVIKFEAINDRCSIFDGLKQGEKVEVSFNLRGREWTNKQNVTDVFNTLDAWRVEKIQSLSISSPEAVASEIPSESQEDDGDNLPF